MNANTLFNRNPANRKHWLFLLIAILAVYSLWKSTKNKVREIDEKTLQALLKQKPRAVKKLALSHSDGFIYVTLTKEGLKKQSNGVFSKSKQHYHYKVFVGRRYDKSTYAKEGYLDESKYQVVPLTITKPTWFESWIKYNLINILYALFMLIIIGSFFFDFGNLSLGRSKASVWDEKTTKRVRFKDIQGMQEAKKQLVDIIRYFKYPSRYAGVGVKPPRGALLIGPPGTGKTLLAKGVAGESNVPFLSINGSEFEEVYVGLGARRVRKLFEQARKMAPCIIYIDEIDAVGGKRNSMAGEDSLGAQTMNQLLSEIDGFQDNERIFLLASTNRPNVLDRALTRSGRFGRKIYTNYPTIKEREATFRHYLGKINTARDVSPKNLSKRTVRFSYADIAEVCNDAGLIAVNKQKKMVNMEDCIEAINENIGGIKRKESILKDKEKEIVAVHESGHAFTAHCLANAEPLVHLTIMPRTNSVLGFAQYEPSEKVLLQKSYILDEVCTLLGGKVAEEIFFGECSTGAENDLERVHKLVYGMVVFYGMNKKIGNISYHDSENGDYYSYKLLEKFSQETKHTIDQEIHKIVNEQTQRAKKILTKYKDKVAAIAKELQKKEEMSGEDFEKIVGTKEDFVKANPQVSPDKQNKVAQLANVEKTTK